MTSNNNSNKYFKILNPSSCYMCNPAVLCIYIEGVRGSN